MLFSLPHAVTTEILSAALFGQTKVWPVERKGFPGQRLMELLMFKETDEKGVLFRLHFKMGWE